MTTETTDLAHPAPAAAGIFPDRAVHQPQQGAQPQHCCRRGRRSPGWAACWSSSGRWASNIWARIPSHRAIPWLPTGDTWFKIGVLIDPLSAVTLFFVAWTVLMIFIYSVGYHNFGQPKGDHDQPGLPPHGATVDGWHGHKHTVPSDRADVLALLCLHRPVRLWHVSLWWSPITC